MTTRRKSTNASLTKALIVAPVIFLLAAVLSAIAHNTVRESTEIEIAIQWMVRLLGITITVVAVLGLFETATGDREGRSGGSGWWAATALVGLMLAYPHWALALGVSGVVIALVVTEGIWPASSDGEP